MRKNSVLNINKFPNLRCLFWDVPGILTQVPVRDIFCVFATRLEEYINVDVLTPEEKTVVNDLFTLFQQDLPEVLYDGWKQGVI